MINAKEAKRLFRLGAHKPNYFDIPISDKELTKWLEFRILNNSLTYQKDYLELSLNAKELKRVEKIIKPLKYKIKAIKDRVCVDENRNTLYDVVISYE